MRAHRARLRSQGLRPIQIWVPDVRAPGFPAEALRQSALLGESEHQPADQDWVDSLSVLFEDE